MSSFAHARRAELRRRRRGAIAAFASVGSIWLLYEVLTLFFCVTPPCAGGLRAVTTQPVCAVAVGAEMASLLLVAAGTLLPAVIAVVGWFRRRARRRAQTVRARGAPPPMAEASAPLGPGRPIFSAFGIRVPNRRRRMVAWAAVLGWNAASWLVPKVFWLSAAASIEGRQVFAAATLPITWWLLEETRFRPRTLAVAMPAFVVGHWSLFLTFLALVAWRVVGFAP